MSYAIRLVTICLASLQILACGSVEREQGDRQTDTDVDVEPKLDEPRHDEAPQPEPISVPLPVEYPEETLCEDGDERLTAEPCGRNGAGFFPEICMRGSWVAQAVCRDEDECQDGSLREGDTCGVGGIRQETCVSGSWEPGPCIEPVGCEAEEERIGTSACGINSRGRLRQTCLDGTWTDTDECLDQDACIDGNERTVDIPCGFGNSGQVVETCSFGAWLPTGCEGADECYSGLLAGPGQECPGGGHLLKVCRDGAWETRGECDACGDSILEGNVGVRSMADFGVLDGITSVTGSLEIVEEVITDLEALSALKCVDQLLVRSTSVEDLSGLSSLVQARSVVLRDNLSLKTLEGLGSQDTLLGSLHIEHGGITDLSGAPGSIEQLALNYLPDLTSLDGVESSEVRDLSLYDAPQLASLSALANMSERTLESLWVYLVPQLADVSGLSSHPLRSVSILNAPLLSSIEGLFNAPPGHIEKFHLRGTSVSDLSPLAGIETARDLFLSDLPVENLTPLTSLKQVGELQIARFDKLTSFPSFPLLTHLGTLELKDNAALASIGSFPLVQTAESLMLIGLTAPEFDSFPALMGIGSLALRTSSTVERLSFPSLLRVDHLLTVSENDSLAELSFPDLTTVERAIVTQNPALPTCTINALQSQVRSPSGGLSIWTVEDNDDAATCAP